MSNRATRLAFVFGLAATLSSGACLITNKIVSETNQDKLNKSMTEHFNRNAYTVESQKGGTYIVSRNDSLFQIKAEYVQVGESDMKQPKITENKFVGMKFK